MSGFIPFSVGGMRPVIGRPPAPVVDRALLRPRTPEPIAIAVPKPASIRKVVAKKGRPSRIDAETVERIRAMRATGQAVRDIGREVGVSGAHVARLTRDVPPPPGGWLKNRTRPVNVSTSFARRLYRSGFTLAEIGKECGCGKTKAWDVILGRKSKTGGLRTQTSRVVQAVADVFCISRRELRRMPDENRRKSAHVEQARVITYWLLRRNGASFPSIAKSLGGFDHTTVLSGCRRVDAVIAAHGLTLKDGPGTAARQLLNVDWRGGASA